MAGLPRETGYLSSPRVQLKGAAFVPYECLRLSVYRYPLQKCNSSALEGKQTTGQNWPGQAHCLAPWMEHKFCTLSPELPPRPTNSSQPQEAKKTWGTAVYTFHPSSLS